VREEQYLLLGRDLESVESGTRVEADGGDGGGEKASGNLGEPIEKRKGGIRAKHYIVDETGWGVEGNQGKTERRKTNWWRKLGSWRARRSCCQESISGLRDSVGQRRYGLKHGVNKCVNDLEELFRKLVE